MRTVLVRLLIPFSVLFSSCKRSDKHYSQIILNADKVQIKKNSENFDTTILASNSILTSFAEILKNYEGNCSCTAKDEVIFFKQGVEVLKVGINQQDKECTFLFIAEDDKKRCYKLNYRVGMMMSEINKKQCLK